MVIIMRKIIFQMMTSLDGYFEGPGREIDWHNVDEEFNNYAIDLLDSVDMLIFGRVTYELMAGYWPTEQALNDDPVVAERMNNLFKVVYSTTLKEVKWKNTILENKFVPEQIVKLKLVPGKDIAIFGSSDLALGFIENNLIDEYRIFINPVVLGDGKTLFKGLKEKLNLKLAGSKIFLSGNVLLSYVKN